MSIHIKRWPALGVLILGLIVAGCFPKNNTNRGSKIDFGSPDFAKNELLVKFKQGADLNAALHSIDGTVVRYFQRIDCYQIRFSSNSGKGGFAAARHALELSNQIIFVEPNYQVKAYAVPNDPDFTKQWGLAKINAVTGWDSSAGLNTINIAVIDTGIDDSHEDLFGKVIAGYNAITNTAGLPGDDHGHGTHCAGIAAANTNNDLGIAGLAQQCKLIAVKVLDSEGFGFLDDTIEGIIWAVDNGADVISLSLGGAGYSRVYEDAVDYALENNVTVVAASGNDSRFNDNQFPAGYPGVIVVGATTTDNTKAVFSTESNHLFITAPGDRIFSTLPGDQYGYLSGTSMATPLVAGAVALIKSKFGETISTNQILTILKNSATDRGLTGWDQVYGWGLLNISDALNGGIPVAEFGTLTVTVTNETALPQPKATVLISSSTGRTVANIGTDANGKASFWSLPADFYTVHAGRVGFQNSFSISLAGGETQNQVLTIPIPTPIPWSSLHEDAESTVSQVIPQGTWGKTSSTSNSQSHCWTDSPGTHYSNYADMSLMIIVDLTGSTNPALSFWTKYDLESGYDFGDVDVSTDGGISWHNLDWYSGRNLDWQNKILNLNAYKTATELLIRFRFTSDYSEYNDGWYVDDILITNL